ncbi:MAG: hypothetical protein GVY13_19175 [Alphaproteobacteria bacterium]|jgi:hypothetical protein|nr:hypothetical protein [Alphaproteobacteria bacterium]
MDPIDGQLDRPAAGIVWNAAVIATLVTILAAGELVTVNAALLWSVTGLLHAPAAVTWALGFLGLVVGLWLCARLFRSAYRAECTCDAPDGGRPGAADFD